MCFQPGTLTSACQSSAQTNAWRGFSISQRIHSSQEVGGEDNSPKEEDKKIRELINLFSQRNHSF